jgi:hypothetical protein
LKKFLAQKDILLLACGKCLFLFAAGEMERSKFEEETNSLELRAVSEE